jgi:hypothetical protein
VENELDTSICRWQRPHRESGVICGLQHKARRLLPGTPTIPEQIATDKRPYYKGLEEADEAWAATGQVDVSALETMLTNMLAAQLLSATKEASGENAESGQLTLH